MSSCLRRLVLQALVLVPAIPALALVPGQTEFQIDHADGRVRTIVDGDLKTPTGVVLATNPRIGARKESVVSITILNPNPLLFVYAVKKGTATSTTDQVQLEKFTSLGFGPLLTRFKDTGGGGPLNAEVKAGQPPFDCSTLPGLADLKQQMPIIDGAAKKAPDVISESLSDPDESKKVVGRWDPDAWKKALEGADKKLGEIAAEIVLGSANADTRACAGIIALARAEIPEAFAVVKKLKAIQDAVLRIGQPLSFPDLFTVNIAENQPIEVEITKSALYPDGLVTTRPLGKYTITVAPQTRARVATLAPAAVFSFVRDPSFEAKASGTQFVINQTENPYKELDLAAMLLVEPDAWDLGSVHFGLQLGASPQKDPGLFLGFSLRATDIFTFGAGVAYQRVTRLKDGLSVGQTIATQDLLKTEKEFKEGLYLHLTVTPKKKS